MTPLASWLILGGLVSLVVACVGALWVGAGMDSETADLLEADARRAAQRDAFARTSPLPWASTSWQAEDNERSHGPLVGSASKAARESSPRFGSRAVPLTNR